MARHIKIGIAQFIGGGAAAHPLEPDDETVLGRAQSRDLKQPSAIGGFERPIIRNGFRDGRKRPQPELALDAMRRPDAGDADPVLHRRSRCYRGGRRRIGLRFDLVSQTAQRFAGAAAGFAAGFGFAAAAAALARASARTLRSLRGSARSGLLRTGRLRTPAASRKRKIRSDGVAPLSSQLLAFSISNLSRSALSLGISGL